ncbi:MAG: hypothetical protein P4M11_03445 [Candidatus Pacebacteria bacterium]|nr:hypothetical protein [Candidatus Paceibacterota bacterium]
MLQCSDPGLLVKDKQALRKLIGERFFRQSGTLYINNDYTARIIPNAGRFGHPLLLLGASSDVTSSAHDLNEFFHNCKRFPAFRTWA